MLRLYCKIGDRELGPISLDRLKEMACTGELSPENLVRWETKENWILARRLKILGFDNTDRRLQEQPSDATCENANLNERNLSSDANAPNVPDVRDVSLSQKWLLWAVLASVVGWFYTPLLLLTIPFQLYSVFRLTRGLAMPTSTTVLYLIAMFLPVVSLVCLLILNGKAIEFLKIHGIHVGLMGSKLSDLPPGLDEAAESTLSPVALSSKTSSLGEAQPSPRLYYFGIIVGAAAVMAAIPNALVLLGVNEDHLGVVTGFGGFVMVIGTVLGLIGLLDRNVYHKDAPVIPRPQLKRTVIALFCWF